MAPFRVGLAGAGRMGRNHMRGIERSDQVSIVAIAEPVAAARTALQSTGITVHADLDAMIAAGDLDGVLVCVPSTMHLDTVKRLVAAGLPILCEKPVGITAEQAREAARLVAMASLPFQVGFWRRFVPMLKRLRDRIAAGELGDIYLVANYQWDGQPPGAYFRTHSGGIFIDMGVHEFDQTRWLTGQEFGAIEALASGVAGEPWPGDPESAQALCDLSGGTSAVISLGRRFPLGDVCKVEVFGTKDAEECRFLWPPTADETFFEALKVQAESFAAYARGRGEREGAGADDAAAALAAAERAAGLLNMK
ncbi:MAG TPA: Gfo/Idh/MocA family oxidoreductase [Candidatus Dormibacteraeota bacterium]|nr:Gfo/Idh/MocA family oxidoreductase [Candidatus Dormibacteraeota bacterium]